LWAGKKRAYAIRTKFVGLLKREALQRAKSHRT